MTSYEWLGDSAVSIRGLDVRQRRRLMLAPRPDSVRDVVSGPEDLVIYVRDPLVEDEAIAAFVEHALNAASPAEEEREPRCHSFDVRYGGADTDLEDVARALGLSAEQVIALHANCLYRVQATGFTPGFAYLGYVHEALRMDRKAVPNTVVAPGAVAVAHHYTGIYPRESAGGWWILGYLDATDAARLWTLGSSQPGLLQVGETVQFYPK
ncbi:MAG: carboxyltransferase domain-containing protein [Bacilli bacterium]